MRKMRRRALRAAVLGLVGVGVFALAPLANAATCVRTAGGGGTAVLTFAAGDGTVTLSNDGDAVTYAVGTSTAANCGAATLANIAQITVTGSTSADTLIVDVSARAVRGPGSRRALAHHCESRGRGRRHLAASRR